MTYEQMKQLIREHLAKHVRYDTTNFQIKCYVYHWWKGADISSVRPDDLKSGDLGHNTFIGIATQLRDDLVHERNMRLSRYSTDQLLCEINELERKVLELTDKVETHIPAVL